MQRLLAFTGGVLSGSLIGLLFGFLFTPTSGDDLRETMRQRYDNAIRAGQLAAAAKRRELEAQLIDMTGNGTVPTSEKINL